MKRNTKHRLSNRSNNISGFSLLEVIVAITVIAAVGIVGILIAMRIQQSQSPKGVTQQTEDPAQQPDTTERSLDSAVFAKYHSTIGGFTMHYPKSWVVQGIKNGVPSATLDGSEDQIRFQVAPNESKINNYGGILKIAAEAPGDEKWPIYPSGTITNTFKNGISMWHDNQSQVLASGRETNNCPTVRIATDKTDTFGYKLKNGKYISYIGSFCWTTGMSTTYTYGQQLESDEFSKTTDMIRSLKQD